MRPDGDWDSTVRPSDSTAKRVMEPKSQRNRRVPPQAAGLPQLRRPPRRLPSGFPTSHRRALSTRAPTRRAPRIRAAGVGQSVPGAFSHWHTNADEWQYYIKGQGERTAFNTGPRAITQNFAPGDMGYVKRSLGHFIRNTGDTDLQFLEVFRSSYFADISLSDWLAHTPPQMVSQHLNVAASAVGRFPKNKPVILPRYAPSSSARLNAMVRRGRYRANRSRRHTIERTMQRHPKIFPCETARMVRASPYDINLSTAALPVRSQRSSNSDMWVTAALSRPFEGSVCAVGNEGQQNAAITEFHSSAGQVGGHPRPDRRICRFLHFAELLGLLIIHERQHNTDRLARRAGEFCGGRTGFATYPCVSCRCLRGGTPRAIRQVPSAALGVRAGGGPSCGCYHHVSRWPATWLVQHHDPQFGDGYHEHHDHPGGPTVGEPRLCYGLIEQFGSTPCAGGPARVRARFTGVLGYSCASGGPPRRHLDRLPRWGAAGRGCNASLRCMVPGAAHPHPVDALCVLSRRQPAFLMAIATPLPPAPARRIRPYLQGPDRRRYRHWSLRRYPAGCGPLGGSRASGQTNSASRVESATCLPAVLACNYQQRTSRRGQPLRALIGIPTPLSMGHAFSETCECLNRSNRLAPSY